MNILNRNLGLLGLLVRSGGQFTNSKISQMVCLSLLASFALCGGIKAQNVLINPGAETGDLTGWNQSPNGYKYVVSTNQYIPNSAPSNYLAHSGKYTIQLFDTTGDSSYIYQDFPAIAGSQWAASCYAIGYASNYFGNGSSAEMMVVFFDTNDNVVAYPPSSYGTLGSQILDNIGTFAPYDLLLPPAVDASGWVYLQPTNIFTTYPGVVAGTYNFDTSGPYPTTLTAPPGTAYVRYQLEYDDTADPAGQPVYFDDCVLNKVVSTDPDISANPVAVTLYAGGAASFSVTATHNNTYPTEKFKYQWYFNKTNLLTPGMNQISSSTTAATLNFTNVQGPSSGLYDVVVTLTSGGVPVNSIRSVPVPLNVLVLDPIQKVNLLGPNAGFENQPSWIPWNIFNGCYAAGPLAAAPYNTYDGTTPIVPYGGSWTAEVGANGNADNGFYIFYPVTPGQLLQAGGYAYISSLNDFTSVNTERVQVWFVQDTSGTPVAGSQILESFKIYGLDYTNSPAYLYTNIDVSSPSNGMVMLHDQLPRNQWCYLGVTNITDQYFGGNYPAGDDLPTNTLPNGYFQVPVGANYIKFQVYENNPGGNAADAVYWDEMRLIQVAPVPDLKATASGGNINLTFSAGPALSYSVLYKTNLTDTAWNILSNNITAPLTWQTNTASVGITYPITVTDIPGGKTRFYRVQSN